MSQDTKQILSPDLVQKQKYLDFLGDIDFPSIVEQHGLSRFEFNQLFASHVLAIGYNATGIREGYIKLEYHQWIDSNTPIEKTPLTPRLSFSFYTSRNALIEPGSHCSNSRSVPIKGAHYFSDWHGTGTREFRNFIIEYEKKMFSFTPEDYTLYEKTDSYITTFRMRSARTKEEKIHAAYKEIIENNAFLHSFLTFHFLQKNLQTKTENPFKKAKI